MVENGTKEAGLEKPEWRINLPSEELTEEEIQQSLGEFDDGFMIDTGGAEDLSTGLWCQINDELIGTLKKEGLSPDIIEKLSRLIGQEFSREALIEKWPELGLAAWLEIDDTVITALENNDIPWEKRHLLAPLKGKRFTEEQLHTALQQLHFTDKDIHAVFNPGNFHHIAWEKLCTELKKVHFTDADIRAVFNHVNFDHTVIDKILPQITWHYRLGRRSTQSLQYLNDKKELEKRLRSGILTRRDIYRNTLLQSFGRSIEEENILPVYLIRAILEHLREYVDGQPVVTREQILQHLEKFINKDEYPELAFLRDANLSDEELGELGMMEIKTSNDLKEFERKIENIIENSPEVRKVEGKPIAGMEELKAKYMIPAGEKVLDNQYLGLNEAEIELLKNKTTITLGQLEKYLNTKPVEANALYIIINFLVNGGSRDDIVKLISKYYNEYKNFRALEFTDTFSEAYLKRNVTGRNLKEFEKELYKEITAVVKERAKIEELRKKLKS